MLEQRRSRESKDNTRQPPRAEGTWFRPASITSPARVITVYASIRHDAAPLWWWADAGQVSIKPRDIATAHHASSYEVTEVITIHSPSRATV